MSSSWSDRLADVVAFAAHVGMAWMGNDRTSAWFMRVRGREVPFVGAFAPFLANAPVPSWRASRPLPSSRLVASCRRWWLGRVHTRRGSHWHAIDP